MLTTHTEKSTANHLSQDPLAVLSLEKQRQKTVVKEQEKAKFTLATNPLSQ